jgi:hypothetical protein
MLSPSPFPSPHCGRGWGEGHLIKKIKGIRIRWVSSILAELKEIDKMIKERKVFFRALMKIT